MILGIGVLVREVSQKSFLALPCCMGVVFFFDSHPAWECDFHTLRHLPSENAIFFIFSTTPQRESQKWQKNAFEPLIRRHAVNDADKKSSQKVRLPPAIAFWNAISILYKFNRRATKTFIFPMNLHNFISEVLPHHPKKLCMLQNNDRFSQGIPSFFHLSVFFPFCMFALPIRSWQCCGILTPGENHSFLYCIYTIP